MSLLIEIPKAKAICWAIRGTAPRGIALLHLDHRFNQILARSFWAGFAAAFRGEQQTVLTILDGLVEVQKSRRFQYDCRTDQAGGANEESTQTGDKTI